MKQRTASPFTWEAIRITKLSQDELHAHRELLLDAEGLAAWQHAPSFVARFKPEVKAQQQAETEDH